MIEALVRDHVKVTLHYNETNEHITHDVTAWMRGLEWDYFDHHNSAQTEFTLKEMVKLYRLGIIHGEYTMIKSNLRSEIRTISASPILSQVLPFHAQRHRYLSLCDALNAAIKGMRYKTVHQILSDRVFVDDPDSMKFVFRSLSSCFSFCPLCCDETNNPLQTLLTLYIRDQRKCDGVLSILKLLAESLRSIHIEIEKSKRHKTSGPAAAESDGVPQSIASNQKEDILTECRCFECCKTRCDVDGYVVEQRLDFVDQQYEVFHVGNAAENDYDFLSLCIVPHRSTKPKYDIQIMRYLLDRELVHLLPHHFVFAVQYHRTKILKLLFSSLQQLRGRDPQRAQRILDGMWLPKQLAQFGYCRAIWLQHPTRISILGFAVQPHVLDVDIVRVLLDHGVRPNFDDLMAITSIAGDRRLERKREIIATLLSIEWDDDRRHFLFEFGVFWFEVCVAIQCFKTAALISSKLVPIIMRTVLDEPTRSLVPRDLLNVVMEYAFYPNDPDDGWCDIDGDGVFCAGDNLEFTNFMGYGDGGREDRVTEHSKEMVAPRAFWQNQDEFEQSQSSCVRIEWSNPSKPKRVLLPFPFDIGGRPSNYRHHDHSETTETVLSTTDSTDDPTDCCLL